MTTRFAIKKYEQNGFEIKVAYTGKDFWLTRSQIAELLGMGTRAVGMAVDAYKASPFYQKEGVQTFFTPTNGGNQNVEHYNLDVVMHIAFRANINGENGERVKAFRDWATSIIRRYLTGELRGADKHAYAHIRDCITFASDYNPHSDVCADYFATIQNKLLYAVTEHTAPELIYSRASHTAPNMGLTHWQHENIRKDDVTVGKNYLTDIELKRLNRLTETLFTVADDFLERVNEGEVITMANWVESVDGLIVALRMQTLTGKGAVSRKDAEGYAVREYEQFKRMLKAGA